MDLIAEGNDIIKILKDRKRIHVFKDINNANKSMFMDLTVLKSSPIHRINTKYYSVRHFAIIWYHGD